MSSRFRRCRRCGPARCRTRIAESLAASLYTTLDAAFVYVGFNAALCGEAVAVAQTGRYRVNPEIAAALGDDILAWARAHDPDDSMPATMPGTHRPIHVLHARDGPRGGVRRRRRGLPRRAPSLPAPADPQRRGDPGHDRHRARAAAALVARQRGIAAQEDRRKDEFLATLSHELRNPLAPLRNSLHLLRLRGDDASPRCTPDDGAPGQAPGAAGRRPAGGVAHQPRHARAAPRAHRRGHRRCAAPSRPASR